MALCRPNEGRNKGFGRLVNPSDRAIRSLSDVSGQENSSLPPSGSFRAVRTKCQRSQARPLSTLFCRLIQRKRAKGNHTLAVKALGHKLARASYYVMRDQVEFDPARLFG
jgi:hypothetical protein